MLLLAFAMLSQRRILSLIKLFAWQGVVLALSTFIVGVPPGRRTSTSPARSPCC